MLKYLNKNVLIFIGIFALCFVLLFSAMYVLKRTISQFNQIAELKENNETLKQELAQKDLAIESIKQNQAKSQEAGIALEIKSEKQREKTKTLIKEVIKYEKVPSNCMPDANSVRIWNEANRGLSGIPAEHINTVRGVANSE